VKERTNFLLQRETSTESTAVIPYTCQTQAYWLLDLANHNRPCTMHNSNAERQEVCVTFTRKYSFCLLAI